MEIKVGDYILENNRLYIVMDKHSDTTGVYYDLKALHGGSIYRAVPRNYLRHADRIIKAKDITPLMKILYY